MRLVANSTDGSIAQRIDYDEFGNITQDTNPGFQFFAFAGGVYDHHTKLTRFGARDYDAFAGRWMAKDGVGFLGRSSNLFSYAFSDPVNYVDYNGMEPNSACVAACTAAGAGAGALVGGALGGAIGGAAGSPVPVLGNAAGAASGGALGAMGGAAAGGVLGNVAGNLLCPSENDNCDELLVKCLENPWQPEWNIGLYGKRKDCGACYRRCKNEVKWPTDMCPL